jgi:hypothetical protein
MTKQGDIALLDDPVAQQLLQASIPAQLGYIWPDGSPRVSPMWFHWDGSHIVLATPAEAPKVQPLSQNASVALTISAYEFPYKVLYVRGSASIQIVVDMVPEYVLMTQRMLGTAADGWLEQVEAMLSAMRGMARIAVTPEWVGILDFEQRLPSAIERAAMALAGPPS